MGIGIWKVSLEGRPQLARGEVAAGPTALLDVSETMSSLLSGGAAALEMAVHGPSVGAVPADARVLAPVNDELIWASGVTYERSRDARMDESDELSFYDLVYEAERPELFIKSPAERVRATGTPITIRQDSTWNVPEPELGVVADAAGDIVAYVIGNDVSSRSIEGANPLYLPQAKTWDGSCSIGPCVVPAASAPSPADMEIVLEILRGDRTVVHESIEVARMHREPQELVDWLFRAQGFPGGVVLLTGTGIVPDRDFTLQEGDEVHITISGLGTLRNTVEAAVHNVRTASTAEKEDRTTARSVS